MAVVQSFNQDDKDNQQQQQATQTGAPIPLSGSAQGPSSGQAQGSSAAPTYNPNSPTSSGRFTNLQNYINANSGYNAQGGGLAGQIQSNLAGQANNIQNAAGTASKQFQQSADSNRTPYDQAAVNAAIQNPSQYTQNQSNLDSFNKLRDATYAPVSTNLQPALNQASQFQSTANLAGTEPGRYALLKNLYGGNNQYNQGQQKLDNLMLQGNPQQLGVLNQIPNLGANTSTNIQNQLNQENALNTQYTQEAADTQQKTRDALQNAITGFGTTAQAAAQTANTSGGQAFKDLSDSLSKGYIPQDQVQKLLGPGALQSGGMQLYGVDPSKFLTQGQATEQNIITPDQYNNIQALAKLSGNTVNGDASNVLKDFSAASQAGTYNPYTFNNADLSGAIGQAKQNYGQDISSFLANTGNLPAQTAYFSGNYSDAYNRGGATGLANLMDSLKANYQDYSRSGQGQPLADAMSTLSSIANKYGINPLTGQVNTLNTTMPGQPVPSSPTLYSAPVEAPGPTTGASGITGVEGLGTGAGTSTGGTNLGKGNPYIDNAPIPTPKPTPIPVQPVAKPASTKYKGGGSAGPLRQF